MFKLVCWNINKQAAPWDSLTKMVERGEADVALLQEAGEPPVGFRRGDGEHWDRSRYDR